MVSSWAEPAENGSRCIHSRLQQHFSFKPCGELVVHWLRLRRSIPYCCSLANLPHVTPLPWLSPLSPCPSPMPGLRVPLPCTIVPLACATICAQTCLLSVCHLHADCSLSVYKSSVCPALPLPACPCPLCPLARCLLLPSAPPLSSAPLLLLLPLSCPHSPPLCPVATHLSAPAVISPLSLLRCCLPQPSVPLLPRSPSLSCCCPCSLPPPSSCLLSLLLAPSATPTPLPSLRCPMRLPSPFLLLHTLPLSLSLPLSPLPPSQHRHPLCTPPLLPLLCPHPPCPLDPPWTPLSLVHAISPHQTPLLAPVRPHFSLSLAFSAVSLGPHLTLTLAVCPP